MRTYLHAFGKCFSRRLLGHCVHPKSKIVGDRRDKEREDNFLQRSVVGLPATECLWQAGIYDDAIYV